MKYDDNMYECIVDQCDISCVFGFPSCLGVGGSCSARRMHIYYHLFSFVVGRIVVIVFGSDESFHGPLVFP